MAEADVKIGVQLDADEAVSEFQKLGRAASTMATQVTNGFDRASTEAWNDLNRMGDAVDNFARDATAGFDEAAAAARKYESQVTAAGKGADKSMRAFTGATANIGAQFQDIAVQAQQGTNWMTVALQQGTQLSGVFSGLGTTGAGAFKAIGSAIMSVLSVQSLLTIGFVGLATVAIQWAMQLIPKAETAEEKLKKNREAIEAIAAAWPDAEKGAEKFLFVLKEVAKQAATDKLTRAQTEYNDALKATGGALVDQGDFLKKSMEGFKNVVLPGQLSWAKLVEEVANGQKTWGDVAKEITAAAEAEMFWKTMNASTTNQLAAMLGALSSMEIGVAGADQILAKFSTDMMNGKENVLGTYEALIKFRDSLPEGDDKQKVDDLVRSLTPLAQKARDLAQAGGDVHQFADGIDRLSSRIHMQERAQKTAEAQQQKYNDALGEMTDLSKDADMANRKALETERDKAIVAARNMEQVRFARDAYKAQLAALNELIASERARANFLAEEEAAQKGYNAALDGMQAVVPKILQTDKQQIESQYQLALAYAKTKEARDAAGEDKKQAQTDLTVNTGYNAAFQAVQQLEESLPKTKLTAQELNDAWIEQARSLGLTAEQMAALTQRYDELNTRIATAKGQMGLQGQLLDLAQTKYAGLNQVISNYAMQVGRGWMSGQQFVNQLTKIRDAAAATDPALAAEIDRIIGLATESFNAAGGLDALTTSGDSSAVAVARAGQASALSGNQAAGAVPGVLSLADAFDQLAEAARIALVVANMTKYASSVSAAGKSAADALAAPNMPLFDTALQGELWDLEQKRNAAQKDAIENHRGINTEMKIQADYERQVTYAKEKQAHLDKLAEERKSKGGRKAKGGGGAKGDVAGTDMSADQLKNWADNMLFAIDPTLKLAEEQRNLAAAVKEGYINQDQAAKISKKLAEQYGQTSAETFDFAKTFQSMMSSWGDQVASSLADAIVNGEDLGQVFQDLIKQLMKMALEMLVLKPLMNSLSTAMGGMFGAPAAASTGMVAANSNLTRSLPAPGMLGARSATVSGGSGTINSSVGGITINFGTGQSPVQGDSAKAKALGRRMRDAVQTEMIRQSRPGGLLWGTR